MEMVDMIKPETSETVEKMEQHAQERAKAQEEKGAELHAELQEEIKELQKISRVSQAEFDRIINKYGTGEYARSLISKTPYTTKTGAGLW